MVSINIKVKSIWWVKHRVMMVSLCETEASRKLSVRPAICTKCVVLISHFGGEKMKWFRRNNSVWVLKGLIINPTGPRARLKNYLFSTIYFSSFLVFLLIIKDFTFEFLFGKLYIRNNFNPCYINVKFVSISIRGEPK